MTTRLTARAMAAGVRTGELSAAELVAGALSAAAALDPALHCCADPPVRWPVARG